MYVYKYTVLLQLSITLIHLLSVLFECVFETFVHYYFTLTVVLLPFYCFNMYTFIVKHF